MEAVVFLLLVASTGSACVVGLAHLLRQLPRLSRLRAEVLLTTGHTLILCGFFAVAPWYIAAERVADSPYGDVYLPYLLVPGVHIYQPASRLFHPAFPWLHECLGSFPASVICVVVGPGLVGLLVGGLQWYLLGTVWERLRPASAG